MVILQTLIWSQVLKMPKLSKNGEMSAILAGSLQSTLLSLASTGI
jgi:hypothetical protein